MAAADELLRPLLEEVLRVARDDARAVPPVDPPTGLRSLLRFQHLPPAALSQVRRVLDEDEGFRERIADEVTEAQVGPAGWLFVTRPEGWERALGELRAAAAQRAEERREQREVHELERRLLLAEDRLRAQERDVRRHEGDAERARAELVEERRQRRELQDQVDELERTIAAAVVGRDEALVARDAALAAAEEARRAERVAVEARQAAEADLASADVAPPADPGPPDELAQRTEAAAAEARRLAEELQFLADEFVDGARRMDRSKATGRGPAPTPSPKGPPPRSTPPPRRRRGGLPPGVAEGTHDAALALLRAPEVRVLVDGYNVTKRAWPSVPIDQQRDRLVRALDDLAARTGARPTVVFDGDDVPPSGRRVGTRAVQVLFSPAGVSADGIVLDCISRCPPAAPVVVVSSDREVRDGARTRGAQVVDSDTFLDVVRR